MTKLLICNFLPIVFLTSLLLILTVVHQPPRVKIGQRDKLTALFPYETAASHANLTVHPDLTHSLQSFRTLVVNDYLHWHARERLSYEAALRSAARSGKPLSRPSRLLIVRSDLSLSHGLGDRFRAIVSAYFLAVLSNRLLLIDWKQPIPLTAAFIPSAAANFTYDESLLPSAPYDDSAIIEGNYYHRTDSTHTEVTTLFMDSVPRPNITRWFSPPDYRREKNAVLGRLSMLQPLPACAVVPHLLNTVFTPTAALRDSIRRRLKSARLARLVSPRASYTAVHARLGLGIGEARKDAGRFNLTRLGTSLRGMARCFVDAVLDTTASKRQSRFSIFLATDTPTFRHIFAEEVRRQAPHVDTVFLDAEVKHVRNLDASAKDDMSIYLDTFVELLFLAKAERIVHLRSGFADLAAWMGGTCNKRVLGYEECAASHGIV